MIREYAPSLSNRGHFLTENEVSKQKGGRDKFMSLFCYDESVKEYVEEKGKIAGYKGIIYLSGEHIIDVDGNEFDEAKEKAEKVLKILRNLNVPCKIYFSGRGFHISIPRESFKWKPHEDLHKYVKDALTAKNIFKYADPSVTDKTRLIRINNTINSKVSLYKVELTELIKDTDFEDLTKDDITSYASRPKKPSPYGFFQEVEPVFDALPPEKKKKKAKTKDEVKPADLGRQPDPVNYPCISDMLNWRGEGKRHMIALRLASWFRLRYPEHIVNIIMEDWRQQVNKDAKKKVTQDEMLRLIDGSYTGHDGSGYNYGCNDFIRESFCSQTCRLYGAKKSSDVVGFGGMEDNALEFYSSGLKPLNLGDLYEGEDFPIYPGELVVLQAEPKAMKTMLIHNWILEFQRQTYFLEMEMSPRQMYMRHRMIKEGKSYEEVESDLKNGIRSGYNDNWLMIDYKPCFPFELEKRLTAMSEKPEIIIVDHIGLMESNNKDMNSKMEEIMGALKEVAIRNNIIVFAISEMTKESMNKKFGVPAIAAARGSARIAYTANKLLSIVPKKNQKGLIEYIKLDTVANREKEGISILLEPKNCKLEKMNELNIGKATFK
tara:strand:- start:917 stop:2728 length:1812 start_codon:yes stop_codon:yes gene_type:complete